MILIAPDKFKGSLTAREAAEIIAGALRRQGFDNLLSCPMADGGDGTPHRLKTPQGSVEVILSHDFAGPDCFGDLPLMQRSSYQLGTELKKALADGKRLFIGLGGTAVCDGGAGMLQALGVRFFDRTGRLVEEPGTPAILPSLSHAEGLDSLAAEYCTLLTALYDVEASLLPEGKSLSALDFVKQKGAREEDIPLILEGLANLKRILGPNKGSACDGAAGGIGFALCSVLGAYHRPGAEAVLDSYAVDWSRISLVISGEGRIDSQTGGGKVPEYMRRMAARHGIPCLLIGGYVEPALRSSTCISTIDDESDYDPRLAAERLRLAAERLARTILNNKQPASRCGL